MDHARHLSSPSPTSPFLFHHSERSSFSKSNPLTPLLSSTAVDVTSVDDCFSSPPPSSHHNSHHHHHHTSNHNHNHGQSHSPFEVVDQRSQSPLIHHHHHSHHSNNHNHNHHHHHHSDSLTGVDDDDGMHNMLSGGSSSSSNSTMPLLTESHHSHHSFSRISLEEYSPLSLVEDCDNALTPISPTSLACASHHSFKSSLNGLNKIDNLVGVDVVDHDVDVNDARSLSPSLLSSSSTNHHHHQHNSSSQHHNHHSHHGQGHHGHSSSNHHHNSVLWSNSSTAISQNTSILNSHTSTSFLLNQHHQQQLNSLMQQLEPQSLDESPQPPCLISSNSTANFVDGHALGLGRSSIYQANSSMINSFDAGASMINRPSSEPPPSCGAESVSDLECKSLNGQQLTGSAAGSSSSKKSKQKQNATNKSASNSNTSNSMQSSQPTRSRRNRDKSNAAIKQSEKKQTVANSEAEKATQQPVPHSSKVHLQLNHHKKLEELQRRLFGTTQVQPTQAPKAEAIINTSTKKSPETTSTAQSVGNSEVKNSKHNECVTIKQEPDSSAGSKDDTSSANQRVESGAAEVDNKSNVTTRTRPLRSRRSKVQTTKAGGDSSSASRAESSPGAKTSTAVAAEKVEPDTTTKSSSDCTKLADLLSNMSSNGSASDPKSNDNDTSLSNNHNDSGNVTALSIQEALRVVSVANSGDATNGAENVGKKRAAVQTIQVQMNPSLTVMATNANGLIHPIAIQQPHDNNGSSCLAPTSSSATFAANQIFCRSQSGAIIGSGQLKGLVSGNELLKAAHNENLLSTWTLQPANSSNSNTSSSGFNANQNSANCNAPQAPIGTHQIAIQVICQDGTSLVLPVTSAAGLNAAVSLTSQHQQLQAVLANNAAIAVNQQRNNGSAQNQSTNILPLVSVSNIVAQQQHHQQSSAIESSPTTSSSLSSTFASSSTNPATTSNGSASHTSSGLAASSPTLAALLDAGTSNRTVNDITAQSIVSNNLLRKLVSGTHGSQRLHIKRGDAGQPGQANDVTFATLNGGSLVISTSTAASESVAATTSTKQKNQTASTSRSEKRAKLENNNGAVNVQATFTLVDPQGLIITSDLEKSAASNKQPPQQAVPSVVAASASTNNQQSAVKVASDSSKQTKMGSSTGNRQVDPTQPFRCEHCNSTFTRLGNFTRHKKIHTVPTKVRVNVSRIEFRYSRTTH